MVKEELYIIVEGERKQLDLTSPSGITLNFVSNLFNDLSKINASYSYTFKLPRTANNVRVLEIVDDVRADGKFTRIKNDAEYVYDGVSLFSNANMYISGVEKESISAVMTWNVNKGLQELEKHDMSLQELGNHLPEGEYDYVGDEISDYEKDKAILIGDGEYFNDQGYYALSVFKLHRMLVMSKFSDYDPTQPYFKSLHNGGLAPYFDDTSTWNYELELNNTTFLLYELENKLSPMPFVETSDKVKAIRNPVYMLWGGLYDDDEDVPVVTFAVPNPIVPVPYLIDIIGKVYNLKFDLSGGLYQSLCLPLSTSKQSPALTRLNYVRIAFSPHHTATTSEETVYLQMQEATAVNNYSNINYLGASLSGVEEIRDDWDWYEGVAQMTLNLTTDISLFSETKLIFEGHLSFVVDSDDYEYTDDTLPRLIVRTGTYKPDVFVNTGVAKATSVRAFSEDGHRREEITFNFNPEEGFDYFETDAISRRALRFGLVHGEVEEGDREHMRYYNVRRISGYLKMYVTASSYPMGCKINLFQNLPDISCMDFVKSICYALGGYPYQDADGVIRLYHYSDICDDIISGNVSDWSKKINHTSGDNTEEFNFDPNSVTGLSLAKKNYFLMKNDKLDEFGNKEENNKLEDAYEHGYYCIDVNSDMLEEVQTLFTFPYYGAFLWSKGFYYAKEQTRDMPMGDVEVWNVNGLERFSGDYSQVSVVGQDMWRIADVETGKSLITGGLHYKRPSFKCSEAKPLLGVVTSISVPLATIEAGDQSIPDPNSPYQDTYEEHWYHITPTGGHTDYLSMRPWNCATDMPKVNGHDLLQELFGNPCLVKEEMNLNVADLVSLDMEKPVFLEKYNSYFAIKNIEVSSSDGVSKVELIRIPTEILEPAPPTPEVIVEPPTVEPTEPEPSDESELSASD